MLEYPLETCQFQSSVGLLAVKIKYVCKKRFISLPNRLSKKINSKLRSL